MIIHPAVGPTVFEVPILQGKSLYSWRGHGVFAPTGRWERQAALWSLLAVGWGRDSSGRSVSGVYVLAPLPGTVQSGCKQTLGKN